MQAAVAELAEDEALVVDGGFSPARLLGAGLTRFVLRVAKNFTARRATLPERKRGRPPERGEWVRPLARQYKGKTIPATPADREESLLLDRFLVRLRYWENLVLADAKPGAPPFTCANPGAAMAAVTTSTANPSLQLRITASLPAKHLVSPLHARP